MTRTRLDYTFDIGGSAPGRKHKFRPGDGVWWLEEKEGYEYKQYGYVVDWVVKGDKRGHYQVVRMTGGHLGARPWGRPIWLISWKLKATGRWWYGLYRQFKANNKLVERGCSCNCCVHEAIPRSMLTAEGELKGFDNE